MAEGTLHDQSIWVVWNFNGLIIKSWQLTIDNATGGRLKLSSHTHFTDNSGRVDRDDTEWFVRVKDPF
jgi:hypothetical protein